MGGCLCTTTDSTQAGVRVDPPHRCWKGATVTFWTPSPTSQPPQNKTDGLRLHQEGRLFDTPRATSMDNRILHSSCL